ncbi:MAG: hypothetical protein AAGC55_33190 [Myxococcota bacterium]
MLRAIRDHTPPVPRVIAPTLPVELEAIVLRAMARDPAQRYPTARAVAEDLRRFIDGDLVTAHQAGTAYRTARFITRHKLLVGVSAAAAVLLLITSVIAGVMGAQAVRANERAERRQVQAEELIDFMLGDLRKKLETVGRLEILDDVGERAMNYFATVPAAELSDRICPGAPPRCIRSVRSAWAAATATAP